MEQLALDIKKETDKLLELARLNANNRAILNVMEILTRENVSVEVTSQILKLYQK